MQTICSHWPLLEQYQRLGGDETKALSPCNAEVQDGKADGVLAVAITGYTFGAKFAGDAFPELPHAAAPAHVIPTSKAAIFSGTLLMASSSESVRVVPWPTLERP